MKTENLLLTNFNNRKFKVTTYVLDNLKDLKEPKPFIIVIPGGSFDHLSARESEPVALAYAARGFNGCVMSYNLLQDEGKIYPDAGLDVLTTVKYFRKHADEYNIDPERIVTLGFSAGAHVASAANVMADSEKFKSEYNYNSDEIRPNETILGYPLTDVKKTTHQMTDADWAELPKEPELVDTALGVTDKTPSTFIFQSWDDPICLQTNSLAYAQALYEHGVNCELHMFDSGYHGYSLATPELAVKGKEWQNNPHTAKWFNLSLEWLTHRFTEK